MHVIFNKINHVICLQLIVIICYFSISCNKKAKDLEHYNTEYYEEEGIYVVKFIDKGGVHAGDMMYYYITDSTSFNEFVGKVDDKEGYLIKIENNKAIVEKYSHRGEGQQKPILVKSETYDINALKMQGHFDE